MLYIAYGPDTFTCHEYARNLIHSLLEAGGEVESVTRLDGRAATPDEIINACRQVSLFGGRPVVVVEGLLTRFEPKKPSSRASGGKKRKKSGLGEWESFPASLSALSESSVLILVDGQLTPANELLSALRPAAREARVCQPLGPDELRRWIMQRVAASGATIEPQAAAQLAQTSSTDLWRLSHDIETLVAYCAGRTIAIDAVNTFVAENVTATIFRLVDAIVEGRQREAQRYLDELWRSGSPVGYVITMVERQLRIIALAIEAASSRDKGALRGSEFASLQEFAQSRALRQARLFAGSAVQAALERALQADRAIKTGTLDERVALDLLISDLATTTTRR